MPRAAEPQPPSRDDTGLKNMLQLIQLRWMAVVGQVVAIGVVHFGFDIPLPLQQMLTALAFLAAFNLASLLRWRSRREVGNRGLFIALLVDVGVLTVQLHLSGGATNPFVFLYLLQVILAAVLLERWWTWTIIGLTFACFASLALVSSPLQVPLDLERGLASPYILGTLLCFGLNAVLLAVFIKRIERNLRERDAHLADLRERAAEEEHIVRIGLLASGAAHELGTPLATVSVILGDWRRMPVLANNPELLQDLDEMQAQLRRCKSTLSGILLSAGEARGESSEETTVATFVRGLVDEWRATRPVIDFDYVEAFGPDLPMVSDSALKQTVFNLLDNALEASPRAVRLELTREAESLALTVSDDGPGFSPEMLAQFGKPYQSSKGRPGGGLGLFLVVNVARTLGGTVAARNRGLDEGGGASVTLRLPLAAIILDEEEEEGADGD